jgi:hypothetical protein
MFTILDKLTGRVLFAKFDNIVTDDQIAITAMCTLPNPDFKDIYFNFETKEFYLK